MGDPETLLVDSTLLSVMHPRQVAQGSGLGGAAWVRWGTFSVYGVKLRLLCVTNRVPLRYAHGTFLPDFQGGIETDDGAEVLFDYRSYGRAYPVGRRRIVASATHLSEDERYRWLNNSLSVGVGEALAGRCRHGARH